MPGAIAAHGSAEAPVTLGAFAWGAVWMPSFGKAFSHPACRAALAKAASGRGSAVVLGSSLGYEAYWATLSYGVRTVGVELLCSLAKKAEALREAHGVAAARFECADALQFRLPADAAVVYSDDTAWDTPSLQLLARKLARELKQGAVVVHNSEEGFSQLVQFRLLERVEVQTSWHSQHPVFVSLRV